MEGEELLELGPSACAPTWRGCSNAGFCREVQTCGPPYCLLALNKWSRGVVT